MLFNVRRKAEKILHMLVSEELTVSFIARDMVSP